MSGKKSFLNWLIQFFGIEKMQPLRFRSRSLHLESLEVREMLSVVGIHSSQDAIEGEQAGYVRFERDDNQGDLTAFYQLDYRNDSYGCYYGCYYGYSGWASNGKDFPYLPGSSSGNYQGHVRFNDGEYYTDLVINALPDAYLEGDERLELVLITENSYWSDRTGISSNTSYTIDTNSRAASLTIFDTTIPTTVWIAETQDGQEDGDSGIFKLQRDNFETELVVYYEIDYRNSYYSNYAGWAKSGTDFETLSGMNQYSNYGSVTFEAENPFAEIRISIIDDLWIENSEQIGLTLRSYNYDDYYSQEITYYLDPDHTSGTVTILDNDPAVNVWITSTTDAYEDGTAGGFQLERDNADRDLTVFYRLDDHNSGCYYYYDCYNYYCPSGWAYNGVDFNLLPGTDTWNSWGNVTFIAGSYVADIPITAIDDSLAEGTEHVRLTLLPSSDGTANNITYFTSTETSTATLAIHDNEPPILVEIDSVTNATEGGSPGFVRLKRSNTQGRLTVYFDLDPLNNGTATSGWAKNGTDISWLPGTNGSNTHGSVTFSENSEYVDIPITPINDDWIEGTEDIRLTLSNLKGDGGGATFQIDETKNSAVVSLIDDEISVTVWLEKIQDGAENGQNGIFRVHRDDDSKALTIWFSLATQNSAQTPNILGWATNGRDFNYLSGTGYGNNRGTLSFLAGVDFIDIDVTILDDQRMEGTEIVTITLEPNTAGTTYLIDEERQTASLEIADDEEVVRVWIEEVKNAEEGGDNGYVRLGRSGGDLTQSLLVYYEIDTKNVGYYTTVPAGWARNGTDFTQLPGTSYYYGRGSIEFASNQEYVDIQIVPVDDSWVEGDEQIQLTLMQGSDCYSSDESIKYLLDPENRTATVQIIDNELPTRVWIDSYSNGVEGGANGLIILKRSHTEGSLQVWFDLPYQNSGYYYNNYPGWAKNGVDFDVLSGTDEWNNRGSITFADGEDSVTIWITVKDDDYIEETEQIGFTLVHTNESEPRYMLDAEKKSATIYIEDNDESVTVWIAETQNGQEGSDGLFVLRRDHSDKELTVYLDLGDYNRGYYRYDGWGRNGIDFDFLPGTDQWNNRFTITFAVGVDEVQIPIHLIDDIYVEPDESVLLRLISSSQGQNDAQSYNYGETYFIDSSQSEKQITITDDDVPTQVWLETTQNGEENDTDSTNGYFRLRRDNTNGNLTVYYSLAANNSGNSGQTLPTGWSKNGLDFDFLPGTNGGQSNGSVTFEDGKDYVDIPVIVLEDDFIEGTEKVQITLTADQVSSTGGTLYTLDDRKVGTLEIADNDESILVWIDQTQDAEEGVLDGFIRVRRDNAEKPLTVRYYLNDYNNSYYNNIGWGRNGTDYTFLPGTSNGNNWGEITFEAQQYYVDIPITLIEDIIVEPMEKIQIRLTDSNGNSPVYNSYYNPGVTYFIDTERFQAEVFIVDNDHVTVWFEPGQDAVEGTSEGFFVLKRDNVVNSVTVYYKFDKRGSISVKNSDFETFPGMSPNSTSGQVTFAAGEDTVRIPLISIDNQAINYPKSVVLQLKASRDIFSETGEPSYVVVDSDKAESTIFIIDNDIPPTVWIETGQDGYEGGQNGLFRFGRDDATNALRIYYRIDASSNVTLGDDIDYPLGTNPTNIEIGFITFAAGQQYIDLPIRVTDDSLIEEKETLSITIISGDPDVVGINTIYTIDETRSSHSISIIDNDKKAVVEIDSVQHGSEGGSNAYFRLRRDLTDTDLTVSYIIDVQSNTAINGTDFAYLPGTDAVRHQGTVTFKAGETYVDIPVLIHDDELVEETETVSITLTSGNGNYELGSNISQSVSVTDNDIVSVVKIDSIQHAVEGGHNGYIRLQRDNTSGTLTVSYTIDAGNSTAIHETDYDSLPGTMPWGADGFVTFQNGERYVDIPIAAVNNRTADPDKNVVLRLLAADENHSQGYILAGTRTATVLIENDDLPNQVWIDSVTNGEEGYADGLVRLRRSSTDGKLGVKFKLDTPNSTAVFGTDFILATEFDTATKVGTLWFDAGQEYADLPVSVYDNVLRESVKTVQISLLSDSGNNYYTLPGETDATVSIIDDDSWRVSVIASDAFASERGLNPGEFTILRTGHQNNSASLRVYFSLSGSATYGTDYQSFADTVYDSVTGTWRGYVDIPAGQSYVTLKVIPVADNLDEDQETVTLTILPAPDTIDGIPAYNVAQSSDTVLLEDAVTETSPSISGDPEGYEGNHYKLSLHSNGNNIEQWEIDWGDGCIETVDGSATEAFHLYPDGEASYSITVKTSVDTLIPGIPARVYSGANAPFWALERIGWIVIQPADDFAAIIGIEEAPHIMMKAIKSGGGMGSLTFLWRESASALLSAVWGKLPYRFTVAEIIEMTREAYYSGNYRPITQLLYDNNNGTRNGWFDSDAVPDQWKHDDYVLPLELHVHNVPPTLTIAGENEIVSGDLYSLELTRTDPGLDTITHWTIDWGDGNIETVEGNPSNWTHHYDKIGIRRITATATDEDGTFRSNTLTVDVKGIILREQDEFTPEYRIDLTVPADRTALVFNYRNLLFDASSNGMIRDAFELALLDAQGNSLLPTISAGRDAVFNATEGMTPLTASGVQLDTAAGTILIDISQLAPGTAATLVVRLVNNDEDTNTSIELNPVLRFEE
ncbi:MAG: hypothetical protein LBK82_14820, partial [Planctomycetaceae bacterium]|nr:hypothetical protein [Planctomycetaceae bacterium]